MLARRRVLMYKKAHFGVLERTVKLTNIYALENKYYIKFSACFLFFPLINLL